jgi:hypothetical protein
MSTERTVENGIERVVNRGPDVRLPWSFHEEFLIPPDLDGDVRFAQIEPSDLGADREGRVYVLDESGKRVVVFGRAGRMVGTVGRQGTGPGELAEPVALGVSADGEVAVYDWAAGGVRRWSLSGDRSLVRLEEPFWGPGLRVAPWGLVYRSLAEEEPGRRVVRLTVQGETRTGVLAETTQPVVRASFPSCGLEGPEMTPVFTPELRWSLGGEVVAAVTGPEYRIQVFDDGTLARTVVRQVPVRSASRDLALKAVGDGLQLTSPVRCRVPPGEVADAVGIAPVVPAISGLAVAPDGFVWVRRADPGGGADVDVDILDPDGAYVGTLPPGIPFPVAFAGRGRDYRAVSIRTSDLGSTEIVIHRIDRVPPDGEDGSNPGI